MFGALIFASVAWASTPAAASDGLASSATVHVSTTAALRVSAVRLAGVAKVAVTTVATLDARTAFRAHAGLAVRTRATLAAHSVFGEAWCTILVNGVDISRRVRVGSVTVHDENNDAPNTATFTSLTPVQVGQAVVVTLGDYAPARYLFNGWVQTIDHSYVGDPPVPTWRITAVDDQVRAQALLPFGDFNDSATVVAQQLVAQCAPAFTTAHVQANLPAVEVHFDGSEGLGGALTQICKLIGGYHYWEQGDLHLFQTETSAETPDPIDGAHRLFADPPITRHVDHSQIRTRVYGRGHGENTLSDVLAGETIVPIADSVMFNATLGGRAIAGTSRFAYTGVQAGFKGGLVGPGMGPTAPLTLIAIAGTGVNAGKHDYAVVFGTAAGKSLPGPLASVISLAPGVLANPTVSMNVSTFEFGRGNYDGTPVALPNGGFDYNAAPDAVSPRIGDTVEYAYSWSTVAAGGSGADLSQDTALSPSAVPAPVYHHPFGVVGYAHNYVPAGWIVPQFMDMVAQFPPGEWDATHTTHSSGANWMHLWRRLNGGPWTFLRFYSFPNVYLSYRDGYALQDFTAPIGGSPPAPNAVLPGKQQIIINALPIGPTGTTYREIFRTVANGTQLKSQQTIANNTSGSALPDTTPDNALGVNAPSADTSGLQQQAGQVVAGATSIPTATMPYVAGGGWVTVGNQLIRYSNKTNIALTGIPASGPGAILTTIPFNATIMAAPALTGVSGLTALVPKGTTVHIWVQRDAPNAQAALAQLEGSGSTGIYEFLVSDERRGEPSLIALCDAHLARYSAPLVTVTYATDDWKTKSGRRVTIALDTPYIHEVLTIQSVEITQINVSPGQKPRFSVTASNAQFSLEDLLRRLASSLEGL